MIFSLLKAQYVVWGLNAPIFAWWAAVILLMLPLSAIAYLWWIVQREQRHLSGVTKSIQTLKSKMTVVPGHGLSDASYASLARIFAGPTSLSSGWHALNALLVRQESEPGMGQYWATESAEVAFSEKTVFEGRINRPFFVAIPGMVTGTGLLFTFLAILVALMDIRIDQSNQVQGLGLLIEGLSGKFVSSIAALFGATIFLLAEKPLFHRLDCGRLLLVQALDEILPRLTPVSVLVGLQRAVSDQTNAFRSFNAELPAKLRKSFSDGVGPDIQRTSEAIEGLAQLLMEAETGKQETITKSLRSMLQEVQRSISKSLEGIGEGFSKGVGPDIQRMAEAIEGLALLLEETERKQRALSESLPAIFLDMQRAIAASLEGIGKGFSQAVSPDIQRIAEALEGLSMRLQEAEGRKQETISESLQTMLLDLQQSLSAFLQGMGHNFKDALTAGAKEEFGRVSGSLGDTERLLQSMNAQFQTAQSAFSDLVEMTKSTTAQQIALGKSQVEDLTGVMRQFMVQMNDSAGASVARIAGALNGVMQELSVNVNELQQKMTASMRENAEKAAGAASKAAEQADSWTSRNTQKFDQLVKHFDSQAAGIKEVEVALLSAVGAFNNSLGKHTASLEGMGQLFSKGVGSEIQRMTHAMEGLARRLQETEVRKPKAGPEPQPATLVDVQRIAASLEGIGQAFSKGVGSDLQRMTGAIEGLARQLQETEGQKQEALAASLQKAILDMQQAVAASLEGVNQIFSKGVGADVLRMAGAIEGLAQQLQETEGKSQEALTASLRKAVLDMQQSMTASMEGVNQIFSKGVGADVQRMTGAIEGLARQLQETEGQSQEALTVSLRKAILDMQQSVTASMEGVNQIFSKGVGADIQRMTQAIESLSRQLQETEGQTQETVAESLLTSRQDMQQAVTASLEGVNQIFSKGVGADVQRMTQVIESLARQMQEAEGRNQEAVAESLRTMLLDMQRSTSTSLDAITQAQRSITVSLEGMGHGFKEALAAGAKEGFGRVSESLGDTERLLQIMNSRFQTAQSAFRELVEMAKSSTTQQIALGKSQVEDLAAVMRQFMSQMNDSAGASVTRIAEVLTGIKLELSVNMSELQQKMTASMHENAEKAADAANRVLEQAGSLTARSVEQFDRLVNHYESQTAGVKDVEAALLTAVDAFDNSLEQHTASVQGMGELFNKGVGPEIQRMAQAIEGLAVLLQEVEQKQKAITEALPTTLLDMERSIAASLEGTGQALSKGVGSDLQRMTEAIAGLARQSQEAEERKQEAIAESLQSMLLEMQHSIASALEGMGHGFKEALAAGAKDGFGRVAESLGETERLLQGMNAQFQTAHSAFGELVEMARSSNAQQIAISKSQVEGLTAALRQAMVQMNESAGASMTRIAGALTGVMHELSVSVKDLKQGMAASMQEGAEKAASAVTRAVELPGPLTARNEEQFDLLVRQYESQAKGIKDIEVALLSAVGMFNNSLEQHAALNADFRQIAGEVNAAIAASADATRAMQQAQRGVEQVAAHTARQLEQANRAQKEVWSWINTNIERYQDVFGLTEQRARDVLSQMTQHLGTYMDANRQVYERLITEADGHLSVATKRLGASVEDLAAFLDNLTESLRRAGGNSDGHGS